MLREIRQDREREASIGVTPPGVAKGCARQKRHDVREALVLRQEEATIREGAEELLRRLQDQAREDRIVVDRSLTARSPRVPRESADHPARAGANTPLRARALRPLRPRSWPRSWHPCRE